MSQSKSAPEPEPRQTTILGMKDGHFVDQHGRVALLRGVNLGGSSKLPFGYGHTDDQDMSDFFDGAASVSFVGRPFPLEEADLHLSRLQRWGLTFLRFIVTWEAIEHAGPGQIDHEYLQYIRAVVEKAADYNMQVYIDPHQDVWSRWTGGDGAPMWTLECIGFEPRNFEATKAALCLETCGLPASKFPKMIWPTNYAKLACATMFTLFWAGKKYAPNCFVDGVQIQEYLQSHYLDSLAALAEALKGLSNVAGYGTMNEPSNGWIGAKDLLNSAGFRNGYASSALSAMALGEGIAQDVEVWGAGIWEMMRGKPMRVEHIDPKGVRAWKDGAECIWKKHGVWEIDAQGKPKLLKPDYFSGVDFGTEFFLPFARRFTKRIQSISPKAMIFTEMPPTEIGDLVFPQISTEDIPLSVNAMHWYDMITLFTTTWRSYFTLDFATGKPAFGNAALRALHQKQLAHVASFGREKMANAPTLIGETGIPYNMNHAQAFTTGDFSAQVEALDNTIFNLESQLLSFTLWNYTADNSHKFGDLWNLEDLSISSPDTESLMRRLSGVRRRDDSARGLRAFARPHGRRIAGIPLKSQFDLKTAEYVLEYKSEKSEVSALTEIYVPYAHYPEGYRVIRELDLPGEHDSYDFGSGAGFYIDAKKDPYSKHYKMESYITNELPDLIFKEFKEVDSSRVSISGHSMGGHGALTLFLKNPGKYKSVSAWAPISNPSQCPWGDKAFKGYLGEDREEWKKHDATELIKSWKGNFPALIDVGTGDNFYKQGQLLPENLEKAVKDAGIEGLTLRYQDGYDHSYFFISTFGEDHVKHAAKALGLL